MTAAPQVAALEATLCKVEASLRESDAEAASAHLDEVLRLCALLAEVPLPADVLARCRALSATSQQHAEALRATVGADLLQAGQSRTAIARYSGR